MSEGQSYYLIPTDETWRLKREGGTKVLREFPSREEAIAFAQNIIAKQKAAVRLQERTGQWQSL